MEGSDTISLLGGDARHAGDEAETPFLQKPFTLAEMARLVASILDVAHG